MFTFCKPISSKKRFSPHRKISGKYTFTLFENADRVKHADWEAVTLKKTVFLEKNYLKIVEQCGNSKLRARYVVVYSDKKPCGIIYFQIVDFRAEIFGDLLTTQVDNIRSTRLRLFENYIDSNKDEVLMRLFTNGNNLISGNYGFMFMAGVHEETAHELLINITETVSKEEKLRGTISAVLLKDFAARLEPEYLFEEGKYKKFLVEPNMIVDLPVSVTSLNEYIQLFSKKYRNRARSVLKAGAELERRDLDKEEIKKHEKEIYALYESVYEKAKFKLLKLPINYFSEVKNLFSEVFFVTGFFYKEKLVAFTSYFLMEDGTFEAHYIGLDYALNQEHCLYQNVLYYNIGSAIENKKIRVNLGRTAAEIKTTVGAKAEDLICYIKPQNTISKLILKPFITFLQPGEWTPRNPFKEEISA